MQGAYIYGDLGSGRIWALREDGGSYTEEELWIGPQIMTSFAEGPDNELYYTNLIPGQLVKLVEAEDDGGPVFEIPEDLVDTGCVDPDDPRKPSSAMIPYDVHAKLWSDAALKNRALAIPDGTVISIDGQPYAVTHGLIPLGESWVQLRRNCEIRYKDGLFETR